MNNTKINRIEYTLFIIIFTFLFFLVQRLFIPRYIGGETDTVNGFYALENDSLHAMFFGTSAIFRGIDTPMLSDDYRINSYNMSAGSQQLTTTYYYMQEAFKTQHPKVVFVEVSLAFRPNSEMTEGSIPWSYAPTKASINKFKSLYTLLDKDIKEAIAYSFFPIFAYHDSSIGKDNIKYYFGNVYLNTRGYYPLTDNENVDMAYLGDFEGDELTIPEENQIALKKIIELCDSERITLVFIKTPSADWTRSNSNVIKKYCDDNGVSFVDFNDCIEDIGLDSKTDFYDLKHLNKSGAVKLTTYIARNYEELIKQKQN